MNLFQAFVGQNRFIFILHFVAQLIYVGLIVGYQYINLPTTPSLHPLNCLSVRNEGDLLSNFHL